MKNVDWWLDIYVYSPIIDETGTFKGYRPASDATILLYGVNHTGDGVELVFLGGSMITVKGMRGALKVHMEFDLTIDEHSNVLEVLIVGYWLTEPVSNDALNITDQSFLLWAPVYYSIIYDRNYESFNTTREWYYEWLNRRYYRFKTQGIELLWKEFNETRDIYTKGQRIVVNNYLRSLKEYWSSLGGCWEEYCRRAAVYVDEHTVNIYLDYPEPYDLAKVAGGRVVPDNVAYLGFGGEPVLHREILYRSTIVRPVYISEVHALKYQGGYATVKGYWYFRSWYSIETSVGSKGVSTLSAEQSYYGSVAGTTVRSGEALRNAFWLSSIPSFWVSGSEKRAEVARAWVDVKYELRVEYQEVLLTPWWNPYQPPLTEKRIVIIVTPAGLASTLQGDRGTYFSKEPLGLQPPKRAVWAYRDAIDGQVRTMTWDNEIYKMAVSHISKASINFSLGATLYNVMLTIHAGIDTQVTTSPTLGVGYKSITITWHDSDATKDLAIAVVGTPHNEPPFEIQPDMETFLILLWEVKG